MHLQVAIGVRVFGDARKTGDIPSMDAYLAQRGQPVKGPIHFGPNSACGRPGLAQYQLFLPLQQVGASLVIYCLRLRCGPTACLPVPQLAAWQSSSWSSVR